MDSSNSQVFGGSQEECHSSESGWTMYIGSPIDDDDDDDDRVEIDVEDQYKGGGGGGGDVESDDSMVSDASSTMAANIHNTCMYQKEVKKDDVDQKKNSRKGKKVEKNGNEGKKKEKESTSMNVAPAQSGNKVRRNWLGKKK